LEATIVRKAAPSEYQMKNRQAGEKLSDLEKAQVLAVIEAQCKFNKAQAELYARLWQAKDDPAELDRIYMEA
jgi:hypothetical protein